MDGSNGEGVDWLSSQSDATKQLLLRIGTSDEAAAH